MSSYLCSDLVPALSGLQVHYFTHVGFAVSQKAAGETGEAVDVFWFWFCRCSVLALPVQTGWLNGGQDVLALETVLPFPASAHASYIPVLQHDVISMATATGHGRKNWLTRTGLSVGRLLQDDMPVS